MTSERTGVYPGTFDPITNGQMIKTKYGDAVQNPLVSIAGKHAADMVRYASDFGLSALARNRLQQGINAPPGGGSDLRGRHGH